MKNINKLNKCTKLYLDISKYYLIILYTIKKKKNKIIMERFKEYFCSIWKSNKLKKFYISCKWVLY